MGNRLPRFAGQHLHGLIKQRSALCSRQPIRFRGKQNAIFQRVQLRSISQLLLFHGVTRKQDKRRQSAAQFFQGFSVLCAQNRNCLRIVLVWLRIQPKCYLSAQEFFCGRPQIHSKKRFRDFSARHKLGIIGPLFEFLVLWALKNELEQF
ncbi:MAG: hypothetical protein CMO74_09265 [Verrucomicrobiales bacterium]|nr:hypothetical protein [Verrucomicrobiales bacterium]MBL68617.1 hypothetical protein [Verrucomicrobiales bacterium]